MTKGNNQKTANGSTLDFEAQLWAAADKMIGHMNASGYKHVCLGLIFLKYISDTFEEKREQLLFGFSYESCTLTALLPKLLSSELRVPAAAKLVEATA